VNPQVRLLLTWGRVDADKDIERLLARRAGLSATRVANGVALAIDSSRIERLGPLVEAVAANVGGSLRLLDIDAVLPIGALDERQSGVWAAIGDAQTMDDLARDREAGSMPDLYRFVHVNESRGQRKAEDGRAPRVEPRSGPSDWQPSKFDDASWHVDAAFAAGDPGSAAERAFSHIGIYLAWLIRKGLANPEIVPRRVARDLEAGTVQPASLAQMFDQKLVSDLMSEEGIAFTEARYEAYVQRYNAVFAAVPEYSIIADNSSYDRVAPELDELFRAWQRASLAARQVWHGERRPAIVDWRTPCDRRSVSRCQL
jgi:hypothetical protein